MQLTITPTQAGIIGKAIGPVLSKDMARPYSQVVEIATGREPGVITFTVTDGYRAHRVSVVVSNGAAYPENILAVGTDLVKALAGAAKAKAGTVIISGDISGLSVVVSGVSSVTVPTYNGHFPGLDSILAGTCETELPANFDGGFFADAMNAGATVAGKGNNVTVSCISPRKPCMISASSPDGELALLAALMPQRTVGSK